MANPRFSETRLDPIAREVMNLSIMGIERTVRARLCALMFVDDGGAFFHFLPGSERDVVQLLSSVDWTDAAHIVEEHCE